MVAHESRPYHHPLSDVARFGNAVPYSLSGWSLHLPLVSGLAQDCLLEISPEFTRFAHENHFSREPRDSAISWARSSCHSLRNIFIVYSFPDKLRTANSPKYERCSACL
jgi:hypothetical protein